MMFAPSESNGFNLVHTAKQYLELVSNPNRVKLEGVLPEWNGEGTTDVGFDCFNGLIVEHTDDHYGRVKEMYCRKRS